MEHALPHHLSLAKTKRECPGLHIAVVTETWPPEVNGVALTLFKLIQQLSQRQHTIQLIRPRQPGTTQQESKWTEVLLQGLSIPHYPQLKLGFPSKRQLLKVWTQQRPDLVHIATEGPLGWSALQAAKILKLPVTSDFRTNFHSYSKHYGMGWLSRPIEAYLRHFHNRTLCTMVPTKALQTQLSVAGFDHLQVVARGVDRQVFKPESRSLAQRAVWHACDDTVVLLSVGRLAAEKNLDVVVNTYKALRRQNRKVKMIFAGDGPYRNQLQMDCPDAVFMGMCNQAQLALAYASADLFLFPSLTETFGNVTLESLASGTPVLAFDCAGATDLIQHQHNGWLVPGDDPQQFVAAALDIGRNSQTLREARQHTANSVRHWDWADIAQQVENLFSAAVEKHAHA